MTAEDSEQISLWNEDELTVSPDINVPITGDKFAMNMPDIKKDTISALVDQLEGEKL